jgi:peptidyl-prolyl cis-trans isomerase SurA
MMIDGMKKFPLLLGIVALLIAAGSPAYSWERYDSVIAVVNDMTILESDLDNKFNQLLKFKQIPKDKYAFEKSRILDKFIEDALIQETAAQESIVVNDKRVLLQIEEFMRRYYAPKIKNKKKLDTLISKMIARLGKKLSDVPMIIPDKEVDAKLDEFIGFLETKNQLPFKDFFEEIRSQLIKEQVISIAIGATPPSKEEAMDWFKKNKSHLGDEVWIKNILIRPSGNSFEAVRAAFKKISEIRKRVIAGESFEKLAGAYSQDYETAARGGDFGWKLLGEMEPYLAGSVNTMRSVGQISQVIKSGLGYHIVKLMGRRPLTYDKVERLIMYKLYSENMYQQFKKWVMKKKRESEILIFLKDYKQM